MDPNLVFVTGGAGYIGSHICLALAAQGKIPVCLDLFSTGHREAVLFGPCIEIDLCNTAELCKVFTHYKPCAVIHTAGRSIVTESITNPLLYYQNNVVATLSLVEAMKKTGVRNLIFSSSASIYSHSGTEKPLTETSPKGPLHPYGKSKWMIEDILHDLNQSHEIRSISLRYFNAAGAEGQIGENHTPETHLIPLTIQVALGMRDFLNIRGLNHPTEDGSAERDYIHVQDLARAHLLALEVLMSSGFTGPLNLGSHCATSLLKIIAMIEERLGPVRYKISEAYGFEPSRLVADSSKAREVLDWRPQKTLEDIIDSAIAWQKNCVAKKCSSILQN